MACRNIAIEESHGYFPNPNHYDEMIALGECRPHYQHIATWLDNTPLETLLLKRQQ